MSSPKRTCWQRYPCVVPNCTVKDREGVQRLSWHKFQVRREHQARIALWINIIRNIRNDDSWTPSPHSRICSRHFEDKCFVSKNKIWTLFPMAVPTKFLNDEDDGDTTEISDKDVEILEMDIGRQSEPGRSLGCFGNRTDDAVSEIILDFENPSKGISTVETCTDLNRKKLIGTNGSTVHNFKNCRTFRCVALNCSSNSFRNKFNPNLSWHSFPGADAVGVYMVQRQQWLTKVRNAIKDPLWTPKITDKICSRHFTSQCFFRSSGGVLKLHSWAIPTMDWKVAGKDEEVELGTDGSTVEHNAQPPHKQSNLFHRFKLRKIPGKSTSSSKTETGGTADSSEIKYLKDRIEFLEIALSQYCDNLIEVSSKLNAIESFLQRELGPKFSTHIGKQNVSVSVNTDSVHKRFPIEKEIDEALDVQMLSAEDSDPLGCSALQTMVGPEVINRVEEKDDSVDTVIHQDILEVKADFDEQFERTVLEPKGIVQVQLPSYRSNKFISELEEHEPEVITQTEAGQELVEIRPVQASSPTLKRPSQDKIMSVSHIASKISKPDASTSTTLSTPSVLFPQSNMQKPHGDKNNVQNRNISSPTSSSVHSFSKADDNSSRRKQSIKSDIRMELS